LDKIKTAAAAKSGDKQGEEAKSQTKESKGKDAPKWNALKDDYMLDSKKNWDEESSDEVIQKTRRKRRNRKSQTRREAAAVVAEAVGAAAEASDARCLVDNRFLIYYILDCDVVPAPDTNHKVDHHERAVHHTASDDVEHPIHTAVDDHSTMQCNAVPRLGHLLNGREPWTLEQRYARQSSIQT
jgi:hypothetical protein